MFTTGIIYQGDLIKKYEAPINSNMSTKFAALEIKSPQELTITKIKEIVKTAYDHVWYSYNYRMFSNMEGDLKNVNAKLDILKNEDIEFTVYASSRDDKAVNIAFNHSWQRK